jgi:signal transduction histidine kinase/ActR/RegA family two-component response regulator
MYSALGTACGCRSESTSLQVSSKLALRAAALTQEEWYMSRRSIRQSRPPADRIALGIAVLYLLLCGLWIIFSDRVVLWIVRGPDAADALTRIQTYKGWAFVGATAILLYFLIRMGVSSLRKAKEDVERARQVAEAASAAKDRFLAILSHELRTPLTPVLASVTALAREAGLSGRLRGEIEMIQRNIETERQLIDDLLDVTRITTGKMALNREVLNVHELIDRAIEVCRTEISAKRLELRRSLEAGRCHVHGDRSRLLQVFWNLVKNSAKFTPEGGRIAIRSFNRDSQPAGDIIIQVSDTGMGIPPDVLPRVFDAFDQGHGSVTRKFGGLGLGLTISRSVVDQHGGTIAAASAGKDRGATFTVELPTVETPPCLQHGEPSASQSASAKRILLVEDDTDTARTLGRLLEEDGHSVMLAASIAAATELARNHRFDLLIADIGLPDGSGLGLLAQVRQHQPVVGIAMSGYGMDTDLRDSRQAGFGVHLVKPVNIKNLEDAIARVATHAREPRPASG